MYKVLIVDDEPMIRQGLKAIIPWEEYGFTVVGDAKNGREALERHGELAPELLVVDIRMPGMDGLQLIEEIRKVDERCRFIILSGYADFTYAKTALKFRIDGYILKPVDEAEVVEHLQRVHILLQKEAAQIQPGQAAAERQEALIHSLLHNRQLEGEELLQSQLSEWKSYQVLLIDITIGYKVEPKQYSEARRRLEKLFEGNHSGIVFSVESWIGILLKQPVNGGESSEELYRQIKQQLAGLQLICFAAAGQTVKQLAKTADSFIGAAQLMKHKFLLGGEQIHTLRDMPVPTDSSETCDSLDALAEKLYYALDIGRKSGVEQVLEQAGKALISYDGSEHDMKTNWTQLISLVLGKLSSRNNEIYTAVQGCMSLTADIHKHHTYAGLLLETRSRLLKLAERIGGAGNEPVLKQLIDFVHNHYSENLKLETLADVFSYNSGYLGKMFLKYTGESFHTYLDKIRIEKATELLGQGMKVHQVAERIGYANVDYFHRKFKRYVGVSPSSYKGKSVK
ncbi:response regulator transcription factor [Paenibacillus thalictri]|uniref:Response regulator transcription factor n=1 Tax=Paenibacillus thalictri TaxID=2527873 RepID=A0A4Q9DEU6_9BACL|nr:response regulator transcription factor [Paenibacillus thalictri]TBL68313.1 response regulator transcription factor [Paenibacillus thalictri]